MESRRDWIVGYIKRLTDTIDSEEAKSYLVEFALLVEKVKKRGNKIILCGNGASNTIASHAAIDFLNQLGVQTISIDDPAFITAAANDFGYERVFTRAISLLLTEGDLLVCISSSGSSNNIIHAAQLGIKLGAYVVTFSGFDKKNKLRGIGHLNFYADNAEYNIVETTHTAWLTAVVDILVAENKDSVGPHGIEFNV